MMESPPTIDDVARVAAVSKSTVSRVLNGTGYVSLERRVTVERAIADLSYRPNTFARLRSKDLRTIDVTSDDLTDEFVARVVSGIVAEANREQVLILLTADNSTGGRDPHATERRVASLGSICIRAGRRSYPVTDRVDSSYPAIFISNPDRESETAALVIDARPAAQAIVRRVVAAGHRRIAVVGWTDDECVRQDLALGLIESAVSAGIGLDSITKVPAESSEDGGRAAADQIFGHADVSLANRPTAVLCLDDPVAIGVMSRCRALGWDVPRDISVTGFGDTRPSRVTSPSLVSASVPAKRMGEAALRMLTTADEWLGGATERFAARITDGQSIHPPR